MPKAFNWLLSIFAGLIALSPSTDCHAQLYKPLIGYDQLVSEYGGSLANGAGITVFMPEGLVGDNYMPNVNHAEFIGKSIVNGTVPPVTSASNHATNVGRHLYGNTTSIAPGITRITGASADDFVDRYLSWTTGGYPLSQGFNISNHSYIGNIADANVKMDLLRRFDYVINRDNTVAVVGANNGDSNTAPDLWTHSFNAITVGRSDGLHSRGTTSVYGSGRSVPDIVVPMQGTGFNFTSFAAPVVGASAAILQQAAGFNYSGKAIPDGMNNQVIRSLLFAGATKDEFPEWSKTTTQPVDSVYGFGQLNIYNSYKMLEGGQFASSKTPGDFSSSIGEMGWDFGTFSGTDLYYSFEVSSGQWLAELSAALVWNVDVFNTSSIPGVFNPSHQLSNLDLELFNSDGESLGSLIQDSLSTAYNYEHIYLRDPLSSGRYTFRITGDLPVDYGFAWRMSFLLSSVPEPSSLVLLAFSFVACLRRRRWVDERSQLDFANQLSDCRPV